MDVRAKLRKLAMRFANSLARAVVQVVDDDLKMQMVQLGVLLGEDVDDVERFQEYGLTSVPHAGAEGVVIFPMGDRSHGLLVAVDDRRYRPTGGEAGEVFLYTDEGVMVKLGRGSIVELGGEGLTATEGVLNGQAIDPFTGQTHFALGNASTKVKAKKT